MFVRVATRTDKLFRDINILNVLMRSVYLGNDDIDMRGRNGKSKSSSSAVKVALCVKSCI